MNDPGVELQSASREARTSGALGWLIHPIGLDSFFLKNWEQRPLAVNRKHADYFSSLLTLDDIDRVITTTDLRYPNLTLKNADRPVTPDEYTKSGNALDVAKVYQLYAEGSTITLAYLDTVIPQLTSLCRSFESELSFPFQANVYLTPAGAKGARHHYDTHDVFVLQLEGSKHWSCYGTPVEVPLRDQDFDSSIHEQGGLSLEFVLDPGDVAYIPRGVVHDARSGDTTSLHITLGVLTSTWADFLRAFAADLSLADPLFRKALPPGFAREGFERTQAKELFRLLVGRFASSGHFDKVFDGFVSEFLSSCPPILRGQLDQMANVDHLALDATVGRRPGVISVLRDSKSETEIECYGKVIRFPAHTIEAVQFAMRNAKFKVHEIPGHLDNTGKLILVRRLIREGLLVVLGFH